MIAGLIIGLLVAVAVPSMRSITGAKLRSQGVNVTSLIQDVFIRAALAGQTYRIVFDLDENKYWVEVSADAVALAVPEEHLEGGKGVLEFLSAEHKEGSTKNVLLGPEFKPAKGELGEKKSLGDDVRFFGIWAEHVKERARSGQIGLYFFPDGYTEEAQISLSDDPEGKRVLVLVVNPLTAGVSVEREEPEIGGEK